MVDNCSTTARLGSRKWLVITHTLTHLLTHLLTHSLTYLFTHLLTHSLTHSLTYSLTYLFTHSLTCLLTHLLTHLLISRAPRFDYILEQLAYPAIDAKKSPDSSLINNFLTNKVHKAVDECCTMRPSVDISLFAESTMLERTY
jgi:hypothetical protein